MDFDDSLECDCSPDLVQALFLQLPVPTQSMIPSPRRSNQRHPNGTAELSHLQPLSASTATWVCVPQRDTLGLREPHSACGPPGRWSRPQPLLCSLTAAFPRLGICHVLQSLCVMWGSLSPCGTQLQSKAGILGAWLSWREHLPSISCTLEQSGMAVQPEVSAHSRLGSHHSESLALAEI